MSRFRVIHETTYRYESRVSISYGQLCMVPRDFDGQRCLTADVEIQPHPGDVRERVDYFGNRVAYFSLEQSHQLLNIRTSSEVEVAEDRGWVPAAGPVVAEATAALETLDGHERVEASHFSIDSPRARVDSRVRSYAAVSFEPDRPLIEAIQDLARRIHQDFGFDATTTTVNSTIDDLFEHGAGVCQDFAHLGVACVRSQGIPARYVSGYLETVSPPGHSRLVGSDVSHAWVSVLVPNVGWIDVDPTNDQFINGRYVTTAWGRDYGDVTPLKGVVFSDGGKTKLDVSVDVIRLD